MSAVFIRDREPSMAMANQIEQLLHGKSDYVVNFVLDQLLQESWSINQALDWLGGQSTLNAAVPRRTSGICVFDMDGTIASGNILSHGNIAANACLQQGYKLAVSTAGPTDYAMCCSHKHIKNSLCPKGSCIIEAKNWFYKGNGFENADHTFRTEANGGKGKAVILQELMQREAVPNKQCVVLIDDNDGYRRAVAEKGFSTVSVSSGVSPDNVACFNRNAQACTFGEC